MEHGLGWLCVLQQHLVHIIDSVSEREVLLQHQLGSPHQVQAGSSDPVIMRCEGELSQLVSPDALISNIDSVLVLVQSDVTSLSVRSYESVPPRVSFTASNTVLGTAHDLVPGYGGLVPPDGLLYQELGLDNVVVTWASDLHQSLTSSRNNSGSRNQFLHC